MAVKENNIEVVELLLSNDADKSIEDKYGNIALDYAIESDCQILINLLTK